MGPETRHRQEARHRLLDRVLAILIGYDINPEDVLAGLHDLASSLRRPLRDVARALGDGDRFKPLSSIEAK